MLFAFSIAPSGGGSDSVGDVVAEAVRVVRESGLPNETTSMFTTIEAESWDEGMAVVKRAVEAVQARAPRVSLVLKADIRPGHTGQLKARSSEWSGRSSRAEPRWRSPVVTVAKPTGPRRGLVERRQRIAMISVKKKTPIRIAAKPRTMAIRPRVRDTGRGLGR